MALFCFLRVSRERFATACGSQCLVRGGDLVGVRPDPLAAMAFPLLDTFMFAVLFLAAYLYRHRDLVTGSCHCDIGMPGTQRSVVEPHLSNIRIRFTNHVEFTANQLRDSLGINIGSSIRASVLERNYQAKLQRPVKNTATRTLSHEMLCRHLRGSASRAGSVQAIPCHTS
jgi:hypothetical protein